MKGAPAAEPDLFSSAKEEFAVHLDVFAGPFEVLLSLIARRRLDITKVSLSQVTDDFIAFLRAQKDLDLSGASEFLVVAATLLDLKAARLLPRNEESDGEMPELLEARDLLFAKMLQYRAFKEVAHGFALRLAMQSLAFARDVPPEPQISALLPQTVLDLTPEEFARLAAGVLSRKKDEVNFDHLHDPPVSVESQLAYLRGRLIAGDRVSFSGLCRDAGNVSTVISRFLAILELLRNGEISAEQNAPLNPLYIIRTAVKPPAAEKSTKGESRV